MLESHSNLPCSNHSHQTLYQSPGIYKTHDHPTPLSSPRPRLSAQVTLMSIPSSFIFAFFRYDESRPVKDFDPPPSTHPCNATMPPCRHLIFPYQTHPSNQPRF
ncbi:hypothetical protein EYC84_004314 [Monilinia fructicola]|uniref:Uncharacterized protein n=1 Tax=Monilinia fructicola TaxID=38448 RepID=A0A5M9K0P8_MONFR|nr:hypothetical protein EYC84_004314 [Monilinia fructicola]